MQIGGTTLGDGTAKICLCLMAQSFDGLKKQFDDNENGPQELYELRTDFLLNKGYEDVDGINGAISHMRERDKKPIILTLRTSEEGGNAALPPREYRAIVQGYVLGSEADIIDIEAFGDESAENRETMEFFVDLAHENGKKILFSNHAVKATPKKNEIAERLMTMEAMGGDIVKVAYMATCKEDAFAMLTAAGEAGEYLKVPYIVISMGEEGKATRICGGDFGSCITFGLGAGQAAAPGQMSVSELRRCIDEYQEGK